jgi:hypothetical protein
MRKKIIAYKRPQLALDSLLAQIRDELSYAKSRRSRLFRIGRKRQNFKRVFHEIKKQLSRVAAYESQSSLTRRKYLASIFPALKDRAKFKRR